MQATGIVRLPVITAVLGWYLMSVVVLLASYLAAPVGSVGHLPAMSCPWSEPGLCKCACA